jgi:hypothetical protein
VPPPQAMLFASAPEASDFLFGSVLGQGSYARVRAPSEDASGETSC